MPEITRDIYVDVNARAIDGWNAKGWEWGTPLSHEEYLKARQGEWRMLLTPTKPVPPAWYPSDLSGLRVLGLASGGGAADAYLCRPRGAMHRVRLHA